MLNKNMDEDGTSLDMKSSEKAWSILQRSTTSKGLLKVFAKRLLNQTYPPQVLRANCKEILDHPGVDLNERLWRGNYILWHAVKANDLTVTSWLLKAHADVNAFNYMGETALHAAARDGSVNMVKLLLEHNANVADRLNVTPFPKVNRWGASAAQLAIHNDKVDNLEVLLDAQLLSDEKGNTLHSNAAIVCRSVHTAARVNSVKCLDMLLSRHEINSSEYLKNELAKGARDACASFHYECLNILLERTIVHANSCIAETHMGNTPSASLLNDSGGTSLMKILMRCLVAEFRGIGHGIGRNWFHIKRGMKTFELLREKKADLWFPTYSGEKYRRGNSAMEYMLCSTMSADLRKIWCIPSDTGLTPLHLMVSVDWNIHLNDHHPPSVLEQLGNLGQSRHVKDKYGTTPQMLVDQVVCRASCDNEADFRRKQRRQEQNRRWLQQYTVDEIKVNPIQPPISTLFDSHLTSWQLLLLSKR